MKKIGSLGWIPIIVAVVLVLLALVVEAWSILPDTDSPLEDGKLTQVQDKAIALHQELTEFFFSFSLALIGGVAFFLKAYIEGDHKLTRSSLLAAEGVIILAIMSLFFGHLTLNAILNSLALNLFSIRDTAIVTYALWQYGTFLAALLAFFTFVHLTFWKSVSK